MDVQRCTLCGSVVRLVQINLTEAIYTCMNLKCIYPFHNANMPLEFVKRNFIKMDLEEKNKKQNELGSLLSLYHENLPKDDISFLDDFFVNCSSVEMTEDDIQVVDSVFEALQNCEHKSEE